MTDNPTPEKAEEPEEMIGTGIAPAGPSGEPSDPAEPVEPVAAAPGPGVEAALIEGDLKSSDNEDGASSASDQLASLAPSSPSRVHRKKGAPKSAPKLLRSKLQARRTKTSSHMRARRVAVGSPTVTHSSDSSRSRSSSRSTESVAWSTLEMSGVAITELVKLVGNLEARIERLETPETKDGDETEGDEDEGDDADTANDGNNTIDKPPSLTFELTASFFHGSDMEQQRVFHRLNRYPFISVRCHKLGATFKALEPTFVPDPEDILEISLESAVIKRYIDALSMTIVYGEEASAEIFEPAKKPTDNHVSFRKPFRWLIQCREMIETKVETLEKDQTSSSPSPEHDLLAQLQYLLAFMKTHLKDQLQLYEDAQAGKLKTIKFKDLWMLFRPGDLTYTSYRQLPTENAAPRPHPPQNSVPPRQPPNSGPPHSVPNMRTFLKHEWTYPLIPQTYKIVAVVGGTPTIMPPKGIVAKPAYSRLQVKVYYIAFTGTRYACICNIFDIDPFGGEKDVATVFTHPLKYANNPEVLQKPGEDRTVPGEAALFEFLGKRGRDFIQTAEVSHRLYEGLTLGRSQEEINTPVVIDFQLGFRNGPPGSTLRPALPNDEDFEDETNNDRIIREIHCTDDAGFSYDWYWIHQSRVINKTRADIIKTLAKYPSVSPDTPEATETITKEMESNGDIFLLPGTVPAFALQAHKWVSLDLSLVKPISDQADWKDLILPSGHKKMVRAVVETHAAGSRSTTTHVKHSAEADIVRGKGKGCIILLHGEPGVGKTSTAECVAAFTKRPLYPITCGDIGYEPGDVQQNLEKHLSLAQKWGCVVLLDEADVFLSKRSKDDVKRNGLVSVFLRILEYFQGILILTTNRVGSIDDAFRSRLHLKLFYPKLGPKQTMAIWKVNLRRLEDSNKKRVEYGQEPIEVQKEKILKYAKSKWKALSWNGRQIRNAFQTVVALAEFEANKAHDASAPARPVVTKKHFKTVAKASVQFDEYLFHTHGNSDLATNARKDQVRWDYEWEARGKEHQPHHHHRHHRFGGDHGLSSDSFSSNSSSSDSSSDSESDADSKLSLSGDASGSDGDSNGGSSDSSDEDKKKKRRKKSGSSSKDKGKAKKKDDKGKKHKSKKDKH